MCGASNDCAEPALNDCVSGTCQRVFSIGAAVTYPAELSSGVGNELVLGNGSDRLTVTGSGSFVFSSRTTGTYAVTVVSQPPGAECVVTNGSGVATSNVFATVTCVRRFTIGGLLTGLPMGQSLVLRNNAGANFTVTRDGPFVFPLQPAGPYAITIVTQPMNATCQVTGGSGPAPTADVNSVMIDCTSAATFTIGGTLSGLGSGKSVVLGNLGELLTRSMNGAFTFPTAVATYDVVVSTEPMGQRCTVMNGTGTATAAVTNVTVSCVDAFTIGGTLTGLGAGKTVVLENGGEQLPLSADGAFQFLNDVTGPYAITVATQPMGQTCTVTNGSGTATMNVTTVMVSCAGAGPTGRDMTFGTAGFLSVARTANSDAWTSMVQNPDGTFVLAGFSEPTVGSTQWIISKVTAAGAVDTTFGVSGHRAVTGGTGAEQALGIARDSSGRFVVAGMLQGISNLDVGVARLTSTGALDTTFGTNGVATFDFGGEEFIGGVAIDSMGRIVVVGRQGGLVGGELLVARLTSAGALDMSFGTNGRYLPTTAQSETLNAVVIDASDNVIAVGFRDDDSAILKLDVSGTPVAGFGTNGLATADLTTGLYADRLNAVALSGTRIVGAGQGLDAAASNYYLAGFSASTGALDTSFGAGGITGIGGATPNEGFKALAPRPGGGWYAAGFSDGSAAIIRFDAAGSQDLTFGTSGEFRDAYGGSTVAFSLAVDSTGRVVIAGDFSSDLGIARVNP